MQTPSSDRSAQASVVPVVPTIEMSAGSRVKWQAMLTTRKIGTAKKLLTRVPELGGEPTARRAFNGQRLDKDTWAAIFYGLKLDRANFFTDVQWFDRTLQTQWQLLWNLATDADDRFGLVLAAPDVDSELDRPKFARTIVARTSVSIDICAGYSGYLILVERDPSGGVVLLCPSPMMTNPLLTGASQRLPQSPPSPFPFFQPLSVGTNQLWAGMFTKLPTWPWLAAAAHKPLRLELAQLTDLLEAASKHRQETQMMRSSYLVTTA
jgi:hypothetical protein